MPPSRTCDERAQPTMPYGGVVAEVEVTTEETNVADEAAAFLAEETLATA